MGTVAEVKNGPNKTTPMNGLTGPKKRVLVVEDNIADQRTLTRLLNQSGFQCEISYASNLNDAIGRCGAVDIVLLDLGLPGCEGSEALEAVRASCPRVAVVIVTGSDNDDLMMKSIGLGAHQYIRKERLNMARLWSAVTSTLMWQQNADLEKDRAILKERVAGFQRELAKAIEGIETLREEVHQQLLSLQADFESKGKT